MKLALLKVAGQQMACYAFTVNCTTRLIMFFGNAAIYADPQSPFSGCVEGL